MKSIYRFVISMKDEFYTYIYIGRIFNKQYQNSISKINFKIQLRTSSRRFGIAHRKSYLVPRTSYLAHRNSYIVNPISYIAHRTSSRRFGIVPRKSYLLNPFFHPIKPLQKPDFCCKMPCYCLKTQKNYFFSSFLFKTDILV
jgi:hypothetical protein